MYEERSIFGVGVRSLSFFCCFFVSFFYFLTEVFFVILTIATINNIIAMSNFKCINVLLIN